MRKIIIVVVFLWGHFSVKALETKMEIRPERPVVGESFQIIIHVYSDKQERPDVFLNFGGLDRISESISKGVEAHHRQRSIDIQYYPFFYLRSFCLYGKDLCIK